MTAWFKVVGTSPLRRGLIAALLYVVLLVFLDFILRDGLRQYWLKYCLFVFAAGFLFIDVVDGATYLRGREIHSAADEWLYVYAVGASWGVPFGLVMFGSDLADPITATIVFSCSAGLGIWMNAKFEQNKFALLPKNTTQAFSLIRTYYQVDALEQRSRFSRNLIYVWPLIVIALLAALIALPPPGDWRELYVPMQLVLLTPLLSIVAPRQIWASPRGLGGVILLAAIGFSYAESF